MCSVSIPGGRLAPDTWDIADLCSLPTAAACGGAVRLSSSYISIQPRGLCVCVAMDPRLVFQLAGGLNVDLPCLLPWGLWGLTASFRTVTALLPQLLGLWAPFQIDPLTFCCHTMLIQDLMIALL